MCFERFISDLWCRQSNIVTLNSPKVSRSEPKDTWLQLAATERKWDLHSTLVFVNYPPRALTFTATELQRHVQLHLGVLSLSLRTPTCGSLPHVTAVTCGLSLSGRHWWWLTASRRSLSRRLYSHSQQLRQETPQEPSWLWGYRAHGSCCCCCFCLHLSSFDLEKLRYVLCQLSHKCMLRRAGWKGECCWLADRMNI